MTSGHVRQQTIVCSLLGYQQVPLTPPGYSSVVNAGHAVEDVTHSFGACTCVLWSLHAHFCSSRRGLSFSHS